MMLRSLAGQRLARQGLRLFPALEGVSILQPQHRAKGFGVGRTGQQPESRPGEIRRHGYIVTCCASEELWIWSWRSSAALNCDDVGVRLLVRRFD